MTAQEATIRRGVRNARYSSIPNHVFEDIRLSMEARWLLCYLLSKPDHWIARIRDIRNVGMCGRDKATAMVNELIEYGYAEREQVRDGGKFGNTVLVVYDEPQRAESAENQAVQDSVASLPQPDLPAPVPPDTVLPEPVNPTPSKDLEIANTDSSKLRESADARENGQTASAVPDARAIERAFWRVIKSWPGFDGMPKEKARRAWFALTDDERERAESRRDAWFALLKAQKKDHVAAPSTYFGEKLFDDVPEQTSAMAAKASAPAFGPAWGANRVLRLLEPAAKLGPPEVTRESKRSNFAFLTQTIGRERAELRYRGMGYDFAANGELLFPDDFELRQWRDHLEANGWPAVNRMHKAAESGNGITGVEAERGAALADAMEPVPVGSQRWEEWRAYHKARGWPWVPDPGKQRVVYFPAGRPEDAIEAFKRRIEGHVRAAAQ